MAFRGWPAEALEFFDGLAADNSKTYWNAHKATYDDCVRAPMVALLAELEPEFGPAKIYRPYRDVRFSKDKTPYKTQIAASFERGGYVRLSADGLGAGSGIYIFSPEQLRRYRDAVADDKSGPRLVQLIEELQRKNVDISSHDVLKRVPPGFDKEHPRGELLKHKGLYLGTQLEPAAWMGTKKAVDRVTKIWRDVQPVTKWFHRHVGPSDEPEAWGN